MTRQEANLLILSALEKYFKDHPDQRFTQALHNLNIIEPRTFHIDSATFSFYKCDYYEEPKETLAKIKLCQE